MPDACKEEITCKIKVNIELLCRAAVFSLVHYPTVNKNEWQDREMRDLDNTGAT